MKDSIKILIADDHAIVRDGLSSLFEKQPDITVVATANNGRSALELTRRHRPDVVLMDVSMPDLNGVEATRQLLSEEPSIKVIALSMHCDTPFIKRMLAAGASGYCVKDLPFDDLVHAVRTVSQNKTYLSQTIIPALIKDYLRHVSDKEGSPYNLLTQREREVVQLIAEGWSTKEIAYQLQLSVKTIETYRSNIMEKLGVHSIAEITKFAIREGLTVV